LEQVIDLAKKVAKTDSTVLLTEKQERKRSFAQAIHENSNRIGKFFVALIVSTFNRKFSKLVFGHKQGSLQEL
jgi:DNA-binding NtrC family response regulator